MSIRTATIEDIDDISQLVSSLSHFYLQDGNATLPTWFIITLSRNEFLQRFENPNFMHLVYEIDNKIIGYFSIKQYSHLYHLFVDQNYQGKGFARHLWEHALTLYRNKNPNNIYTVRSSIYAVPIYKKFGFVESGPVGEKEGIAFQPMEMRV